MGAPQYEQAGADIGGTGTTNTIPRWTGPSTLGDSVLVQVGSNIGVGMTSGFPGRLGVLSQNLIGSADITFSFDAAGSFRHGFSNVFSSLTAANNTSTWLVWNAAGGQTQVMTANGAGNVGIGTASPTNNGAGTQTLMVNGSTTGVYDLGVTGARQGSWFYSGGSVNIGSIANVPFALVQNATIRWSINTSGHFLAGADNSYDIGASGATRPRIVYVGTGVVGGYIRAGAASAGVASTTTIGNGTSTTATAGAQTLPANPLGFIIAHVGTTEVRIPYYAV